MKLTNKEKEYLEYAIDEKIMFLNRRIREGAKYVDDINREIEVYKGIRDKLYKEE